MRKTYYCPKPQIGTVSRRSTRAFSSAWKNAWFATKKPGVQIPQRPPPPQGLILTPSVEQFTIENNPAIIFSEACICHMVLARRTPAL